MPEIRPSAPVPAQRGKRLEKTLKTSDSTDDAVRSLTRALAADLNRTVTHDEVISAAVMVGGLHMALLVQYVKERTQ